MSYTDPKLKSAFVKAIKHYFDKSDVELESDKLGERKYNKKYLDSMEEELLPSKDVKEKKAKKNGSKSTRRPDSGGKLYK